MKSAGVDGKGTNGILGDLGENPLSTGLINFIQYPGQIVVTETLWFNLVAQKQLGVLFFKSLF